MGYEWDIWGCTIWVSRDSGWLFRKMWEICVNVGISLDHRKIISKRIFGGYIGEFMGQHGIQNQPEWDIAGISWDIFHQVFPVFGFG